MQVLAVASLKGGVGKTAICRNLGAELAKSGRRVLLVDADPQAGLTRACGLRDASGRSIAEVIGDVSPGALGVGDVLCEVSPGLWLAPSDLAMARCALALVLRPAREQVLRRALATVRGDFDVCVVDTPPSVGLLTVAALCAADGLLVPTLPEMASLYALKVFWATVDTVRRDLRPDLEVLGVVLNMYDPRLLHTRDAEQALLSAGYPMLETRVGRTVRIAESVVAGQALRDYDATNPRVAEFRELSKEVTTWLERGSTPRS